jgi:hypothetical protein
MVDAAALGAAAAVATATSLEAGALLSQTDGGTRRCRTREA